MTDTTALKSLIAGDPALTARWAAFRSECERVASESNCEISPDEILSLSNARLFVLTGDTDFAAAWEAEAKERLPQFRSAAQSRDLRDALAEDKATEEQQKDFESMSRQRRMQLGREIDKLPPRKGTEAKEPLTGEARDKALRLLDSIKSPALRLMKARELGLS